jgi:non-specific serine/threonine protein kinase
MRKSQSIDENIDGEDIVYESSESDDDEGTDSFEFDDKEKLREKRKGLDLATTLERIEKNFVITDPRLPDNPIVRSFESFVLEFNSFNSL